MKSINKNLTINEVFNLAIESHQKNNLNKAQNLYNEVLQRSPSHTGAYNNLGMISFGLGDYQKATIYFEKSIEINPNSAHVHNSLGVLSIEEGKIQKAKNCHERAIELEPNYADAHCNLGLVFKELGDSQKAKSCYEKTIEINPNHLNANGNLGNLLYETGEPQKAIIYYEKAIQIKPGISNLLDGLLKSLYKINNQSLLFKKLDSIIRKGEMNAVIGSICSRAEVKYGVKKKNPFCNNPLDYVSKTDLTKKYDFKNIIVKGVNNILKNDFISNRTQKLITNGYQTAGNLFVNENFDTKEIQRIIHAEIENYRSKFKNSKEGFLKNWPTNYNLSGWLVSMKKGGKLSAHMHELGWLSGSIYVNVPQKLKADSGNLVVCIEENVGKKSIDVFTGSLCLFPSSLLHYTIPFEAEEERIVLAFDVEPN